MPGDRDGRPAGTGTAADFTKLPISTFAGLPPAVKDYISSLGSICDSAVHTTDPRVATLALHLIHQAPAELSRLVGGAQ